MKLPTYMKSTWNPDGSKVVAKIYVKWWGWPIIMGRVIRGVKANWLGWLCLICILPKVWISAVKNHTGINVTVK